MNCPKCQSPAVRGALFCAACGAELPAHDAAEMPSLGELPTLRGGAVARPAVGDTLVSRYRILGELGRGGMGVVYKCLDEVGGIEVALKALPPELSHNSGEMEEVRENFQLVSKLVHQHIAAVKTLEKDPQSGDYYLILELAEGVDLRRWRKQQGGQLALGPILPVLRQIAEALDYAHGRKVMHRDIKPGNVMVGGAGAVKVLDFGLAAQIQSSLSRVSQVHFSTSGTGPYMAPEQWRGQRQDGTADQYALAVMAYELLAGHLPFETQDQFALRESVIREQPQRPEGFSDGVWLALQRGLSKEAAQRYGSCSELVAALGKDAQGESVEAGAAPTPPPRPIQPPPRNGRKSKIPLVATVIAAVLLLLLLAEGRSYWAQKQRQAAQAAAQAAAKAAADQAAAQAAVRQALEDKAKSEAEAARLAAEKQNADELAARKAAAEKAVQDAADIWKKQQQEETARADAAAYEKAKAGYNVLMNDAPAVALLEFYGGEGALKGRDLAAQPNVPSAIHEATAALNAAAAAWPAAAAGAESAAQAAGEKGDVFAAVLLSSYYAEKGDWRQDFKWMRTREKLLKASSPAWRDQYATQFQRVQALANQGAPFFKSLAGKLCETGLGVNKDLAAAGNWYRQAAAAGNALAEFQLGYLYFNGVGVSRDYVEALKWYRQSAVAGNAAAQNNLGYQYKNGFGVAKDYTEALKWFRQSSEAGCMMAQWNLGTLYLHGLGVAKDYPEALKCFQLAADQGNGEAENDLGLMYQNGYGVTKDYTEALKWFRAAAAEGSAAAQSNIGYIYKNGYGVNRDYTEAMKWYRQAADAGHIEALHHIGVMYQDGLGVTKDYTEAIKWYRQAADKGYAESENNLGILYQNGYGVDKDYPEAMKWYHQAADAGSALGMCNLGVMYQLGLGVDKDYAAALKYYQQAADLGDGCGLNNLGVLYEFGLGVDKDYAEALKWFRKSADAGYVKANNRVGIMYENGWGVPKDPDQATQWYRKAASGGDDDGRKNLQRLGAQGTYRSQ